MKILILMGKFSGGGSQRSISYLSQHLPNAIQTTIVVTNPRVDYPYKGELRYIKLSEFKRRHQYHIHLVRFWQRFFGVKKIMGEVRPDFVISLDTQWSLIGILLSSKCIFYIQNAPSWFLKNNLFNRIKLKFICARAYKVVAPSYGVKEDLENTFRIKNSAVIHNAIDLEEILEESKEPLSHPILCEWFDKKIPVFITIGRESWQKGHWHLIRAFSKVREKADCRLVIVGGGVDSDTYINGLIKDFGLEEDILLVGFQKNPFPFLTHSNIFVLPSIYEGFGHVCLEAMACGLPVILSDCPGGPREILAPDTSVGYKTKTNEYAPYGILTPVCDGEKYLADEPLKNGELSLARAMSDLLGNENKRREYSRASLRRVRDFDKNTYIKDWVDILG